MDLEKGIKPEAATAIGASDAQIPLMAKGKEKELPISDLCVVVPAVTDGAVTAANMNPGKNKSLRCWLVVTAVGMFLTNHILQAAPKHQLMIPLEPMVIFTMFMCAIFFVFRTIKQM